MSSKELLSYAYNSIGTEDFNFQKSAYMMSSWNKRANEKLIIDFIDSRALMNKRVSNLMFLANEFKLYLHNRVGMFKQEEDKKVKFNEDVLFDF